MSKFTLGQRQYPTLGLQSEQPKHYVGPTFSCYLGHFKKLATKTENSDFDLKYLKQVEEEVDVIFSICTNTDEEVKNITDKEILNALKSLNRGKAPDVYGVKAEHLV